MRKLLCILLPLLFGTAAFAGDAGERPPLRWGIDWGYGTDIYTYRYYIYTDPQVGYLVPFSESLLNFRANAYITAKIGYEPIPTLEVSLLSGIMGLGAGRSVIPVGLQLSWHPSGCVSDGLFLTTGAGVGLNPDVLSSNASFALLGAGWRTALNPVWDLDIILRVRAAGDAPPIWDEFEQNYIQDSYIRKNIAVSLSMELGIALSF